MGMEFIEKDDNGFGFLCVEFEVFVKRWRRDRFRSKIDFEWRRGSCEFI